MYSLIRAILFRFNAERAHEVTTHFLKMVCQLPGMGLLLKWRYAYTHKSLKREVMGISFPNPVGLAAGLDKDAVIVDELANLGFGFIEIGTLTPKPQPGNPKPRLFRVPRDGAIINRMGFNNEGVAAAVERLKKRKSQVIVGGNIGKNKDTPIASAYVDYNLCVEALYPYVDYFVVNVSSPNTEKLRELQEKERLHELLNLVKAVTLSKGKTKPVLLKIAPDVTKSQLDDIIEIVKETGTDGVIATNTTVSRSGLTVSGKRISKMGTGGMSGRPLYAHSTEIVRYLRERLGPKKAIIGVGGIMSPNDAIEKLLAGADLIQVYTGFVYEGPSLVKKINKRIVNQLVKGR